MKYSLHKLVFLGLTVLPGFIPISYAENNTSENMIITATRSEQASIEIPASIQIISAKDLEASGITYVSEALSSQAGIQINDLVGNSSRASISMRGFGENSANNVLVLIDGRRLNNPTQAQADLSAIAMQDIERIEIIQGSAGTLYGDQATGGVINIISKRPEGNNAYFEAARGSNDFESYRGAISQGFDNGFAYRLSGQKLLSDNYRDNNEANYSNIFTTLSYDTEHFSLFTDIQKTEDDLQLPGALTENQRDEDRKQANPFYPDDFSNRDTDMYRVGGEYRFNQQWRLAAEYSERETGSVGLLFNTDFTDSTRVKNFSPRLLGEMDSSHGTTLLTLGLDYQDSEYRSNNFFGATRNTQDLRDSYVQLVYPVSPSIKLTAGTRHSSMKEEDNVNHRSNNNDKWIGTLGASWQARKELRYFIRFDENIRWANGDDNAAGFTEPGVDFLKPQTSLSTEMGLEYQQNSWRFSALVYNMAIDDEILYDPSAGFFGANINLDESRHSGLVLDGKYTISPRISLSANYSYIDAEIRSGTFAGKVVPFIAEQTANLMLNFQIDSIWTLYLDAQFTGNRYRAGDNNNALSELGSYTLYNLNLRGNYGNWYGNIRLNNLSGKKYESYSSNNPFTGNTGYPAAELDAKLTLGYRF